MKEQMKVIGFAALCALFVVTGASAASGTETLSSDNLCKLIEKFKDIFKILRTVAFVGAAFMIAKWAWGYIEAGKIDSMGELKSKGLALLIGSILLFGIGALLTVLTSAAGGELAGCVGEGWN